MRAIYFFMAICIATMSFAQSPFAPKYDRWRIGGYGEMVAKFMDYQDNRYVNDKTGATKESRNTISIPRFVLAIDYAFNDKWQLGAEIEYESGGTGVAFENENEKENGEMEVEYEQGGEVAIEQFHLTRLICTEFNVRVGHMIVPLGITNAHHEPINFFGTVRSEGETRILPSTWHETGLSLFGRIGYGTRYDFGYQAMVVTGLNPNGFGNRTWIAGGKQGLFEEDNFTCPAYFLRLDYHGVRGLRIGVSAYYCPNVAANAEKSVTYAEVGRIPVWLWNVDAQYKCRYLTLRANIVSGHVAKADALSRHKAEGMYSSDLPYSKKVGVAERAVSYGAEMGLHVQGLWGNKAPNITPFVRYEYYNSQEKMGGTTYVADLRDKVSVWSVGLNYRPIPSVVLKADYTTRKIGGGVYNNENSFSLGAAFVGWFN